MKLNLDFKKVFIDFVAVKIRREKMTAWVEALLSPLQSLHDQFVLWHTKIRYDLSFTGQQVYLEHLLNDVYDDNSRRIYIDDPSGTVIFSNFIFNKIEAQPAKYIYNKSEAQPSSFVYNKSEASVSTDDFIVYVPSTIFTNPVEIAMKQLIDKYRAAGKKYSFQTF